MTAAIGVFGKHPGYGDFIAYRVDAPLVKWFQDWLDGALAPVRAQMGEAWANGWDAAPTLRFWIGRGVSGRTCAGILVPSRDKVGRRYPLVVMASSTAQPAPVSDPDQAVYERLEGALRQMGPEDDIKAVVSGLAATRAEDDADLAAGPTLWAHHPDGDLGALLRSAGPEDARRAVTGRSYWWVPGSGADAPAVWLGVAGLPDPAAMGWLLFGAASQTGGAGCA